MPVTRYLQNSSEIDNPYALKVPVVVSIACHSIVYLHMRPVTLLRYLGKCWLVLVLQTLEKNIVLEIPLHSSGQHPLPRLKMQ